MLRWTGRNARPHTVWGGAHEWNAWEFAAEVGGVALAVLGVMQDGVDVMEDVPLAVRRL